MQSNVSSRFVYFSRGKRFFQEAIAEKIEILETTQDNGLRILNLISH